MLFDFQRFAKVAASVYNQGNPYSLEECLKVFRLYFQTYEEYMGCSHPPIRASQIARIMQDMPWVCEEKKDSPWAQSATTKRCGQSSGRPEGKRRTHFPRPARGVFTVEYRGPAGRGLYLQSQIAGV